MPSGKVIPEAQIGIRVRRRGSSRRASSLSASDKTPLHVQRAELALAAAEYVHQGGNRVCDPSGSDEQQRSLDVVTDEGEMVRFALNRATGRYLSDGRQAGARLLFTRR